MLNNVVDKIRSFAEDLIKDKRSLIKFLSIVAILMLALVFKMHESGQNEISVEAASDNTETEQAADNQDANKSEGEGEVCVDIGGAVENPGVYKVKNGTRLYEVIEMAGGLRSDADTDSVNQAAVVEDGVKIIIPIYLISENREEAPENTNGKSSSSEVKIPVNSDSNFVNINTADKEQLKTLSGIGDVIADRIIEYRSTTRFNKKEDIMSVKGIGSAIYEKIKDRIIV